MARASQLEEGGVARRVCENLVIVQQYLCLSARLSVNYKRQKHRTRENILTQDREKTTFSGVEQTHRTCWECNVDYYALGYFLRQLRLVCFFLFWHGMIKSSPGCYKFITCSEYLHLTSVSLCSHCKSRLLFNFTFISDIWVVSRRSAIKILN